MSRYGCIPLVVAAVSMTLALAGCGGGEAAVESLLASYEPARSEAPPAGEGRAAAFPLADAWAWPDMDKPIGAAPATPPPAGEKAAKTAGGYEHWRTRRGPAYPDDWLHTMGRDAKEMPERLWDDTKATFTDPPTLIALGASAAAGAIIKNTRLDGRVADHYKRHGSGLNHFWDNVGDVGGNPGTHFAVAGAMYCLSLYTEDVKAYETTKALVNALAINGLVTLALKGIAHTESPNGDELGWPSGHTSSTFCLATVLHEAYGPWVGVPLFAFATFVGYERVDARNHDFSDVISGAVIGIAIGHAVMQNHRPKVLGFEVIPWANPADGAAGLALVRSW